MNILSPPPLMLDSACSLICIFLTGLCCSSFFISFLYLASISFHTFTKRRSTISNSFFCWVVSDSRWEPCFFLRDYSSF